MVITLRPTSRYLNLVLSNTVTFTYKTKNGKEGKLVLSSGQRQIDLSELDLISFDDSNVTSSNQTDIKVFI